MSNVQSSATMEQGAGAVKEALGRDEQLYTDWLVGQLSKRALTMEERHWLDEHVMGGRKGQGTRVKNGSVRVLAWFWAVAILVVGAFAVTNWLP